MNHSLSFRVLGPLEVRTTAGPVNIGGRKPRLILAVLLLNAGRAVSADRLISALWGDEPPERAAQTLQVHVSNLRKLLGDRTPSIITQRPGYLVGASAMELDVLRFEELVQVAHERQDAGAIEEAVELLGSALALWRGTALEDLEGEPFADAARVWLDDRRLAAIEDRIELLLGLGRHRRVVGEIENLVSLHPLREPLWEHLIVATYRCGRQADALAAYERCRTRLLDELGLEPGQRLRDLERAVLNQDVSLDLPKASGARHGPAVDPETGGRPPPTIRSHGPSAGCLVLSDGSVIALGERATIGRHPGCDITLADGSVSRFHAEVRPALGGHILIDLASSNGTRVGTEVVMQRLLEDGDEIHIGPHRLTYLTRDTDQTGWRSPSG